MRPPWTWPRRPLTMPPPREVDSDGRLCLVHLVRPVHGLESLREFSAAVRRHPAGIEHELVVAMKGFASAAQAQPYLEEIADLEPNILYFVDRGMDLGVYFAVAARLRRTRYCFLNCHARPLVDGWLDKLDAALAGPDVGMVGASGSWASFHSWMTYSMGLPSAYRSLLPPVEIARRELLAIEQEGASTAPRWGGNALLTRVGALGRLPEELLGFEPFPTFHLRPNAFMITHETLRALRLFTVRTKMHTYVLESGQENLTQQVENLGLAVLVVDREGALYAPRQWDLSRTFWQGDQERLLIADNQTRNYANGDAARRELLSAYAWGPNANPYQSGS
jgi:hypothetical protein